MAERTVEWIIANAINEQARGNPEALASDIIAALEKAGIASLQRTPPSGLNHSTS